MATGKALSTVSTTYPTPQAGDIMAFERANVVGKTTYDELQAAIGASLGIDGNGVQDNIPTFDVNGDIQDSGVSFSGLDTTAITGTAAADGNLAAWNADGDLVDGGAFAESLGANGYTTFPNGLIVQWGFAVVPSAIAITFPLTFPTNVYSVVATGNNTASPMVAFIGNRSTTAFDCRVTDINGNFVTNGVFWMATGD